MRELSTISIQAARKLVDFRGGAILSEIAEGQLEGAVAIHNLLARKGFAYLADEVGMGKTYVALGAVAMLRYLNPGFRVLYIAPRENIQRKWIKELRNFVASNWLHADQRVRTVQGTPAVGIAFCDGLMDWTRKAVLDPNRNFFTRLTSFSLPLLDDPSTWDPKRNELLDLLPLSERARVRACLKTQDKETFKRNYGLALNTLLPHYDLVVVDEAHNLKRGRASGASRNQLIQFVLGTSESEESVSWLGYGKRFERLLLLSATPLESEYKELWNQLDLFGFGETVAELAHREVTEEQQQRVAASFLVRRLANLQIGGRRHTKNMYRREWRGGGCLEHDEPLEVPDQRQRLIVGLVQKKVAEVLGDPRFGASFQIGMLSSFESFLETAGAISQDESNFDQKNQSDDKIEREGVDRLAVGELAHSYHEIFGEPMPHPKMDSIVESLTSAFVTGEKTLVFVRRVRSVDELAEKLARAYDKHLISYLEAELPKTALPRFRQAVSLYEREHLELDSPPSSEEATGDLDHEPEDQLLIESEGVDDRGGRDTFFSWFFRGDGPKGYLSGAAFKKNRLRGEGSVYSTLFEDNYVADLLGAPRDVVDSLAHVLGRDLDRTIQGLRKLAYKRVSETERKKHPRLRIFHAYQEAALVLLSRSSDLSRPAKLIHRLRYSGQPLTAAKDVPSSFPDPHEFLNTETFFTLLRQRASLYGALWPQAEGLSDEKAFLDRERRRELLSAATRLGHSLIDVWLLAIKRIGSLRLRAQQDRENAAELASDFLDRLESQQDSPEKFTAFRELHQIAQHHDLIHAVNFPEANEAAIRELPRLYARSLGEQTPVAGMSGGVNSVVVKQFRLPGYPLILISTDVLQEGEDLHTFCARVIHYGISWTPSAMEQRTGRVDRIGSLIHRQLQGLAEAPGPDNLLQVYYPYLSDTVERLQVSRVLERMNRFLLLTHKGIGKLSDASKIDMRAEFARVLPSVASIDEPLETAFPVSKSLLKGGRVSAEAWRKTGRLTRHLRRLVRLLKKELCVEWDGQDDASAYGTVLVSGQRLVLADAGPVVPDHEEIRVQPFVLFLRSSIHQDASLLHLLSPVGKLAADDDLHVDLASAGRELGGIKICTTRAGEADAYSLTVEGDLLFDPELTQLEEVIGLLERVCVGADQVERRHTQTDQEIEVFRKDLHEEARRAAH